MGINHRGSLAASLVRKGALEGLPEVVVEIPQYFSRAGRPLGPGASRAPPPRASAAMASEPVVPPPRLCRLEDRCLLNIPWHDSRWLPTGTGRGNAPGVDAAPGGEVGAEVAPDEVEADVVPRDALSLFLEGAALLDERLLVPLPPPDDDGRISSRGSSLASPIRLESDPEVPLFWATPASVEAGGERPPSAGAARMGPFSAGTVEAVPVPVEGVEYGLASVGAAGAGTAAARGAEDGLASGGAAEAVPASIEGAEDDPAPVEAAETDARPPLPYSVGEVPLSTLFGSLFPAGDWTCPVWSAPVERELSEPVDERMDDDAVVVDGVSVCSVPPASAWEGPVPADVHAGPAAPLYEVDVRRVMPRNPLRDHLVDHVEGVAEEAVGVDLSAGRDAPVVVLDDEVVAALAGMERRIEQHSADAVAASAAAAAAVEVRDGPRWFMVYRSRGRTRDPRSGRFMRDLVFEDPDA
eukprot:GHVU01006048.1.p1 GENE.GHVU01006048.1~~GHVU01006048.1.p1  ORF type:complete len:468 (+),score=28.63 GHVU01006048.1:161-1564(+)